VRVISFSPSTPDTSDALADRDEIERAFRRLSPDHRAVLVLHHYLGLPLVEVAATLGIPAGTARSRLHNASRVLRSAIEADSQPTIEEVRLA
jgi:RNA polymerase sigma-70 factor (ECF subfamily)